MVGGPENNFTLLISPQKKKKKKKKKKTQVNSPNLLKNNVLIHICKVVASINNTGHIHA